MKNLKCQLFEIVYKCVFLNIIKYLTHLLITRNVINYLKRIYTTRA